MNPNFIDRIHFFVGNGLAAFLDFSVGMFLTAVVFYLFDSSATATDLFVGGLLALVPDFDIVPQILIGREVTGDHRQTLFHRPLLMIPLVTLTAFAFGGVIWLLTAGLCVIWHFVHDTDFSRKRRYGIAWFWPKSKLFWSWFGSYPPPLPDKHQEWLKNKWLKPSILSVNECFLGLVVLVGAFYFTGLVTPLAVGVGVSTILIFLWV